MTKFEEVSILDGSILLEKNLLKYFRRADGTYYPIAGMLFSLPRISIGGSYVGVGKFYVLRQRRRDIYIEVSQGIALEVSPSVSFPVFSTRARYSLVWRPDAECAYGMDLSREPREIQELEGVYTAPQVTVPINIVQQPFPYVPLRPREVSLEVYSPSSENEEIAEVQLISAGTGTRLGRLETHYHFTCGIRVVAGSRTYYGMKTGTVVYYDSTRNRIFWVPGPTDSVKDERFITHILDENPDAEVI